MQNKRYNKSIIQRKTLARNFMDKCKHFRKKKKTTYFHRRSKNISATNSSVPTNSSPASGRTRSTKQ